VCRQEALEAAISEKDAHLALLEVSGIRTARQAEEADQLHADRRRLMEKLKEEVNDSLRDSITLLQLTQVSALSAVLCYCISHKSILLAQCYVTAYYTSLCS
jgi:hypothetical protein